MPESAIQVATGAGVPIAEARLPFVPGAAWSRHPWRLVFLLRRMVARESWLVAGQGRHRIPRQAPNH